MSSSGRDNLSRRTHTYVPGVGQVPVGPRSVTPYLMSASTYEERRSERTSLEQSWSPPAQRHGSHYPNLSPTAHALRQHLQNDRAQSRSSWSSPSLRATSDYPSSSEDERSYRMRGYGREQGRGLRQRSRSPVRNNRNSDPNRNLFSRRGHVLADYEESLVSAGADDEFVTPPYVHVQPRPPAGCKCPIGDHCQCRALSGKMDCRPPVPPPKNWSEGETETIARLPRNLTTDEVRVVAKLKRLEHYYNRLRIEHPRTKAVCEDIEQWGRDVQLDDFIITEGLLTQSRVLSALQEFLENNHSNLQKAREDHPRVVEDLKCLVRKWGRGDLDNDSYRGLNLRQRQNGSLFWVPDKEWEHYTSADYFGEGNLVTGQHWPGRVHMMRDGAHSTSESGISGTIQKGARSLVMGFHDDTKREYYGDRDYATYNGEVVRYNGTARRGGDGQEEYGHEYSIHTRMLLTSIKTNRPVRLFRSHKLPHINELRPAQGYRYDGLYVVEGYEVIEQRRGILGFNLRRVPGQRPVRKHDQRTFKETPEQAASKARDRENSRSIRASLSQARSAALN